MGCAYGVIKFYPWFIFLTEVAIYLNNKIALIKKLAVPHPHTDNLKRSFSYSGAGLWNSLLSEI